MTDYQFNFVGVIGDPVAENPAVPMTQAAFDKMNLKWKYIAIQVKPDGLGDAIRGLRGIYNMMGANITMPYKTDVIQYLDELSPDAEIMGAVNLIRKDGEKLIGENTDGKGFMRSLIEDADVNAKGKKVVLLGAGGAARAIAVELALSGASSIIIVNRTESRAKALASLLIEKTNIRAKSDKWDTSYIIPEDTNILINATSIGFSPDINSRPDIEYASISRGMIVCDVVMNPPRTLFLQEAEIRGATVIDGLGMIAYQGAIGFKMWTGIGAPVQVMKDALKHEFNI